MPENPEAEMIESAMDRVLRLAVSRKDDALIEAYLEIYQKRRPSTKRNEQEMNHAALRLGLLLGAALAARRSEEWFAARRAENDR